jgi:excinuclease ABC subunit C
LTFEKIKEKKIKPCLYYYINQCLGPCGGKTTPEEYGKVVKDLELFLKGDFRRLMKSWERKMVKHSKRLEFEKAAVYRDLIKTMNSMFSRIVLREVTMEALEERIEVSKALNEMREIFNLPKLPIKIEAFDVSNIFGSEAVGSMVSFFQGLPDKSNYRRYKIKFVKKIDDYAMISEIIKRRYKRLLDEERDLPDLIVVDGGAGHLSTAIGSLKELKVEIPIISIAKRMERIFSPYRDEPLVLEKDSEALKLIQRIRNEAHRFAIAYHRLRRKKALDEKKRN